jgi:predicted acetyltransferase
MNDDELQLSEPRADLRDDFISFVEEFAASGEHEIDGIGCMSGADFAAGLRSGAEQAQGRNLPPGWVPASTFWLVRGGRIIVATSNLRHCLNSSLEYENGHIGYSVRPSQRRKGYGTKVLELTLEVARRMGLVRVLVTCDKDNVASAGVILKNGGMLDSEVPSRSSGKLVQRYWITL